MGRRGEKANLNDEDTGMRDMHINCFTSYHQHGPDLWTPLPANVSVTVCKSSLLTSSVLPLAGAPLASGSLAHECDPQPREPRALPFLCSSRRQTRYPTPSCLLYPHAGCQRSSGRL